MGNRVGMPSKGQLIIELLVTNEELHVKVHGTGLLSEITKYFSKEREPKASNIEEIEEIEEYKFAINVEIEEDQDGINLLLQDSSNSDTSSGNHSDSDSDSDNDTFYSDSSDKENSPAN